MSLKNFLASRKAVVAYMGAAMVLGFGLAVGVLALNGSWVPQKTVLAEAKPVVVPAGVFEAQNTFRAIAKAVLPAVVEVRTEGPATSQVQSPDLPMTPPFDFFFGPQGPGQGDQPKGHEPSPKAQKAPRSEGLGSGVMVQRTGDKVYILTNNHVVENSDSIHVKLLDGREYKAELIGTDARRDLAMISITTKETNLVLAKLGNSDDLQVGDWVLAMGNPLGLDFSVTSGIVSALGRQGGPDDTVNINSYIQTDASINRGNSGGALVNLKGEVIGINTWIASPNGASVGLGFAIPINSTKRSIEGFIANGKVQYGWLGASVSDVSDTLAKDLKLPDTKGSYIPHIFRGSPADKAGILPGDFVIAIDGKKIEDTNHLVQAVGDLPAGQSAVFTLIRDGVKIDKKVTIDVRPKETDLKSLKLWPGFIVTPITSDIRDQLSLDAALKGLIVARVEDKSTADIAGLKVSDVLTKVNNKPVLTVADFYHELNSDRSEVKLTFVREGVELSITITR